MATPPDNPAGPFQPAAAYDESLKATLFDTLRQAPANVRHVVAGLDPKQLDTRYKNWTIRQIVHHLADSHVHSFIRFRWALTESHPTIKAYEEADWVQLDDCRQGIVEPSLALLDGLHARWLQMMEAMNAEQFARTFFHPQTGETVTLWAALNYYAWHARHHPGQIRWLREQNGW